MKAKNTSAGEALEGVRDILAADGVVCGVVGTRLLGERVGPDAPILADLGFSGSSLYWRPNKAYDQITVAGASHPRTHKTELRSQPYTPNAKTGEWPIEKIVARIKLSMQTRAALGANEAARINAANAQAFAFGGATAAARAASSNDRRIRLTLGPRPTLTIEWPDTTPEAVLAILKSLEER